MAPRLGLAKAPPIFGKCLSSAVIATNYRTLLRHQAGLCTVLSWKSDEDITSDVYAFLTCLWSVVTVLGVECCGENVCRSLSDCSIGLRKETDILPSPYRLPQLGLS